MANRDLKACKDSRTAKDGINIKLAEEAIWTFHCRGFRKVKEICQKAKNLRRFNCGNEATGLLPSSKTGFAFFF